MTETSATIIARRLAEAGCRHAFGMPGGEVLVMLDALEAAGIAFTLAKHENAAGMMAEGTWHMTGAPGILLTTVGPGIANALNTVTNAWQEQVPLIVIAGCIAPEQAEEFTHQVFDQCKLLEPITKATFRVGAGTAGLVIDKALSVAQADPPGPVFIDLPDTIAPAQAPDLRASPPAARPVWGPGAAMDQASEMLSAAERPLILAGVGAVLHGAGPAIQALAERDQIPVLTTYKAKGIVPEDHPLCLGGHGLSPLSDQSILPLLGQSDCILLAGYDPIEMRSGWVRPWEREVAIDLTHTPVEHGMHSSALRVVADVRAGIEALTAATARSTPAWPGAEPAAARTALAQAFAVPDRWGPHQVFDTLNRILPPEAVTTVDSGAHRILISQMWRAALPGHLLQSTCFCTMGVSVPLAIGVARADPHRPVVAVVGDGGFDMFPGDLATLRDIGTPTVIVVLVDDSLALIEKKQTAMQLPTAGVTLGGTDIPAVARAYGGYGHTITDADALATALTEALSADRFTVLACEIDKAEYNGAF